MNHIEPYAAAIAATYAKVILPQDQTYERSKEALQAEKALATQRAAKTGVGKCGRWRFKRMDAM
jgi:hypothetical protein